MLLRFGAAPSTRWSAGALVVTGALCAVGCGAAPGLSSHDADDQRAGEVEPSEIRDGGADVSHDGLADAPSEAPAADALDGGDAPGGPACGEHPCGAGQVCVHRFCGGGPSRCVAPGDGGACPDGWTPTLSVCEATGNFGCDPPPCQDPPPQCADFPAACGGHLACPCAADVCGGLSCALASGNDVMCAAQ
jgi:hypothetical protein